ncbi:TonB-dependent receptor [Desulfobacter latus]|uniref:TonB-dependent receptor n=2 Tax=Desulfobacter latus TaxID=2292 RepID=A0A850T7Q5_9BACT|nr:TonB-dependent receptor [Desulfobacter latus]
MRLLKWQAGAATLCLFWFAVFLVPGHVLAQKPPETEKEILELEELTVIGTQPGVDITTEKTVVDLEQFKKPGATATLTDVLSEIGGVDVQRANALMASPGDEVSIRGLNEGRMVIEIDGRRINHTGHYGRYIVDWSTLTLDDVEKIEIIRGGHSVLHPFAIGGVINIITKKGPREGQKFSGNVNTGYARYGTWAATASLAGSYNEYVDFNFSGGKQSTDGYLRNNFQDTKSFNGHVDIHLPSQADLSLGIKHTEVEYGMPVVNDPNDSDPDIAALYDPDYPIFTRGSDQLRHLNWPQYPGGETPFWERETNYLDAIFTMPAGPGTIKVHGFMTDGRRRTSLYDKSGAFSEDKLSKDRTQGVIAEYSDVELFDDHCVTLGVEYQELGDPGGIRAIYRVKSAYIQDVISLGSKWKVTPGVRYYHLDKATYYSWMEMGFDSQPGGWPFAYDNSGKTETDSDFFPSLKVDYRVTPDTTLYAAASKSYRLPCP